MLAIYKCVCSTQSLQLFSRQRVLYGHGLLMKFEFLTLQAINISLNRGSLSVGAGGRPHNEDEARKRDDDNYR